MGPHLTSSSSDNRTIAALQQEVDDFQLEWRGRACQLLAPNDRMQLTRQVDELWQTLSATIVRLSVCAMAPSEIMKKIGDSLRRGQAELDASLMRFQAGQAYLERASEQLDQKLANPSATGFGKFVVPNFTIAGSTLKSKEERSCPVHQSMRLSDSRIESSSTGHGAKKGVGKSWEGSTKDEEQLNLTVPTSTQRVIRVTPSSMGFSSDGSIGPISKLLLTDPVDFLVDIGRNVLEKILPQELHRERALILTSNSDHNGAFNLSVFTNIRRTFNFRQIERNYKVTYKKVSDVSSLCRAIDEVTEAQGPVHLLIIRAHGTKRTITLDENNSLKVGDPLPNDSCFRRLPPKATVVVEGCSTGKGKEMADNLANYIAQYMDDSIRIFSPTEDVNHMHLSNNHPIEVRFIHLMARDRDATYTIDERNRGSIQERRSIITKIPSEYEDGYESLLDDIEADLDAF